MELKTDERSDDTKGRTEQPERVAPPWQALVLVCAKCKGARRGPDARDIRKRLKRAGKDKQLRVIESECMSICPDDAITVCSATCAGGSLAVHLVRSERELDALAERLSRA